jgi:hypothetical protein
MATQIPARNSDLDRGPAVAATTTASASSIAPPVRVSRDDNDTENSSNGNGNSSKKGGDKDKADNGVTDFKPSPRFWAILITCAIIALLSALENTVITTALPHIVADLEMGENYVWITNVFFLTGYVYVSQMPCN